MATTRPCEVRPHRRLLIPTSQPEWVTLPGAFARHHDMLGIAAEATCT